MVDFCYFIQLEVKGLIEIYVDIHTLKSTNIPGNKLLNTYIPVNTLNNFLISFNFKSEISIWNGLIKPALKKSE